MKTARRMRIGLLFIAPSLAGVIIFVLAPFADVVSRSFRSAMSGQVVGLQNYKAIFTNEAFVLAASNTMRFMAVCIPLLILLSLLLAVLLYNHAGSTGFFKTTFLIPLAVPVASVALLWRVIFHRGGLLSSALVAFGGQPIDWMNSDWAFWVLVFSYIWKNLGYDLVLWIAGLSTISSAVYEAAAVDGAGSLLTFWRITLPNLMPSLYTITVLSFLNSFKVFREAYLVAGDYPHTSMYLLQHLFNNWFRDLSMDKLAAAAVVVAVVIMLLIFLLQAAVRSGEAR